MGLLGVVYFTPLLVVKVNSNNLNIPSHIAIWTMSAFDMNLYQISPLLYLDKISFSNKILFLETKIKIFFYTTVRTTWTVEMQMLKFSAT